MCLTCQWKLGAAVPMVLGSDGTYFCQVCKTTRRGITAAPVLMARSGISKMLFIGGFMLLLLASVTWSAFPQLQTELTWSLLFVLYAVYFGLGIVNLRKKLYA